MAIQISGGGSQIKRHSYQQNAEINVTPFVDVILVLLIIFMVVAPLSMVDVPVDLPPNAAAPTPPPLEPIYISVQKNGTVYIQNDRSDLHQLIAELQARTQGNHEVRLFVRGDRHAEYGQLMAVMTALQAGGYTKIGLLTEEVAEQ
ncbi:membrane spanning protein in TonB-ExbB-ExbD complex [Georgfuchsia toluolica]|uniref:Membrane spanning protein in TonB-ExbB-ExbD complex n=1 Tax=Georgfuchsia toluolica TaxID=424218 RepID=A0A916J574_9PROT|nr:biopolymer transporter ExbD [Georgfuchsia toluolica]CAG4884767.1 membrane spanning protein in TonB-ExbB-ExbD complex [Georgfuchsia toluolica]